MSSFREKLSNHCKIVTIFEKKKKKLPSHLPILLKNFKFRELGGGILGYVFMHETFLITFPSIPSILFPWQVTDTVWDK